MNASGLYDALGLVGSTQNRMITNGVVDSRTRNLAEALHLNMQEP